MVLGNLFAGWMAFREFGRGWIELFQVVAPIASISAAVGGFAWWLRDVTAPLGVPAMSAYHRHGLRRELLHHARAPPRRSGRCLGALHPASTSQLPTRYTMNIWITVQLLQGRRLPRGRHGWRSVTEASLEAGLHRRPARATGSALTNPRRWHRRVRLRGGYSGNTRRAGAVAQRATAASGAGGKKSFSSRATAVLLLVGPAFTNLVGMLHQDHRISDTSESAPCGVSSTAPLHSCNAPGASQRNGRRTCAIGMPFNRHGVGLWRRPVLLRLQYRLWNQRPGNLNPTEHTGGFGGGFMGLYRGAVGALGSHHSTITPVVFFSIDAPAG